MDSFQPPKNRQTLLAEYEKLWAQHPRIYDSLAEFQRDIGYTFRDPTWLYEALTHRSAVAELGAEGRASGFSLPWNERLEFLGDSVLGLAVTRRLMERSEKFAEGDLSRIRAALVNEDSLAKVARSIGLGEMILLGKGEERSGGRRRESLLGDSLEALIGAVFQDGGFAEADGFVGRLFEEVLSEDIQSLVQTDYKTLLQEVVQDQFKQTPTYELARAQGPDHNKRFEVVVSVAGQPMGRGQGGSKKRASQEAARAALDHLVGKTTAGGNGES